MDLSEDEVFNSIQVEKKELFPTGRWIRFAVELIILGVISHFGWISGTVAILIGLAIMHARIYFVLAGIFKQMEWLRMEAAYQRIKTEKTLDNLYDMIKDKNG